MKERLALFLLLLLPPLALAPAWATGRIVSPGDGAALHLPLRTAVWDAWRQGELPSWNGAIFSGTPLLAAQEQRTSEEITVERILIDARVTDYDGDPIVGLKAEDFEVKVDGKSAKVESVLWFPETIASRIEAGMDDDEIVSETKRGRLFIYFVQTDFAREPSRLGAVAQDQDHLGGTAGGEGVEEGLQIGASPRDRDGDAHGRK